MFVASLDLYNYKSLNYIQPFSYILWIINHYPYVNYYWTLEQCLNFYMYTPYFQLSLFLYHTRYCRAIRIRSVLGFDSKLLVGTEFNKTNTLYVLVISSFWDDEIDLSGFWITYFLAHFVQFFYCRSRQKKAEVLNS